MRKKTAEKQVSRLGTRMEKLGGQLEKARKKAGETRGDVRVRALTKHLKRSQRRAALLKSVLSPRPEAKKKED